MAAYDPQGAMGYWLKGQPFNGILRTGTAIDVVRYWLNGLIDGYVYPESVTGSQITAIAGVTWPADIASIAGLDSLYIRKVAGVNAQ